MNINKIATLRNARGGNVPDVLAMALDIERFGAEGITVHPRPDERHIRRADVRALAPLLTTEFNMEGYPAPDFLALVREVRPAQVTFVPDPPDVLTSNAGWDALKHKDLLKDVVEDMHDAGIRTSLFLAPDQSMVEHAAATGTDRIELYTEAYARQWPGDPEGAVAPYREAARAAKDLGLGVNAGHDLDRHNLRFFQENVPGLLEVSIGHALICDALVFGMENTVGLYLRELRKE